jgi:hypothetical protein
MSRGIRSAGLAAMLAATVFGGLTQTAASAFARELTPAALRPAFSGREVFKIVYRKPGPTHPTASAWGAFTAAGQFIREDATLVFPKGRITVRRHVLSTTYSGPDLTTCRFTIVQKGKFVVTKATGKYRGLHDSGKFATKLSGRLKRTGPSQCGSTIVTEREVTYEIGTAR